MAIKLAEQTNGPHIFMRLRLDSGRVEEIDAYITEEGWRYVTSADRTPEGRLGVRGPPLFWDSFICRKTVFFM